MKLWPWPKDHETPVEGPPISTQLDMPEGTTVDGKWFARDFGINGTVEIS